MDCPRKSEKSLWFLTPAICEIPNKRGTRRRDEGPFALMLTSVEASAGSILKDFTARKLPDKLGNPAVEQQTENMVGNFRNQQINGSVSCRDRRGSYERHRLEITFVRRQSVIGD
jgi:hypothetical protein